MDIFNYVWYKDLNSNFFKVMHVHLEKFYYIMRLNIQMFYALFKEKLDRLNQLFILLRSQLLHKDFKNIKKAHKSYMMLQLQEISLLLWSLLKNMECFTSLLSLDSSISMKSLLANRSLRLEFQLNQSFWSLKTIQMMEYLLLTKMVLFMVDWSILQLFCLILWIIANILLIFNN